jgi:restriction endonuclease S subunit
VKLGEVCEFEYGKPLKEENRRQGKYPVFGSNGIVGYHDEFLVEAPFIVVGRKGSAGAVTFSEQNGYPIDTTFFIRQNNKVNIRYLALVLPTLELSKINTQSGVPGLNRNDAYRITIPLPPLSIQKEIVAEIENKQRAIDEANSLVEILQGEIAEVVKGLFN